MQRRLAIAALCTVLSLPAWAQMRGGTRGSSPMGGGFSARGPVTFRSAPSLAGPPRGVVRFGTGVGFGSGARFGNGVGFGSSVRFGRSFRRPVFFGPQWFNHRFFFTSSPWFFPFYGYPAYYGGYSYPLLDSYPAYYDTSATYNTPAAYDTQTTYNLQSDIARQQEDIDRLEDEVAGLREERQAREAIPPSEGERKSAGAPTLLVFSDKHSQEVRNYAIVGQTLWIFSEQRATKLPLSSLDIDATRKANDERGLDFQVPQ